MPTKESHSHKILTETGIAVAESVQNINDVAAAKTRIAICIVYLEHERERKLEMIHIYTDGSCDPLSGIGGWAAIVLARGQEMILSGHAFGTNHQRMELTAAIEALLYLQNLRATDEIVVHTDSQYLAGLPARRNALIAAELMTKKRRVARNSDLLLEIFGLLNHFRLSFLKIQSHQKSDQTAGLNYNREVDKLSRKIVRDFVRNARLSAGGAPNPGTFKEVPELEMLKVVARPLRRK
jgi:ribonuclease HI